MAFHSRPFNQRFQYMGDEAEAIYEAVVPMGSTIRFGWNRPKGINFSKLPAALRHMPDYYAQAGYFVEVMGLGKDGILKSMKVAKYDALKLWAKVARIFGINMAVFVWNSYAEEYVTIMWEDVVDVVSQSKRKFGIEAFNDGNEYHPIPWEWLTSRAAWVGQWSDETAE